MNIVNMYFVYNYILDSLL